MTEQPGREKAQQRILALLAKAEDSAATEEEADAFREKAYELIAKYGLDQAKLRAQLGAKAAHDELIVKPINFSGKYVNDQLLLLSAIAKAIHVQLLRKSKSEVLAFGYESDIERLVMLFASLWLQASGKVAKTPTPFGENRVRFVKSFLAHFLDVVYHRLSAAEKRAKDDSAGYGIVLQDRNRAALSFMNEWLRSQGLNTRPSSVKRYQSGKESGTAAGRTADIGQTRVGGGRLAIERG